MRLPADTGGCHAQAQRTWTTSPAETAVSTSPVLPARELEGDLLMELGRPAEALAAYEKTLEREPNRARTLFGAARAAERAGDAAKARTHYAALLELMGEADAARPEPAEARRFLAVR